MNFDAHDIAASIDTYLTRITPFGFSGAALLAHGEEILLEKGYGLADRGRGVPNTPDTVFSLGSVTKTFTAVAVMKLVQDGRLGLETRLGELFAGVPADKGAVTIRQLLTHTAGVVNYTGEDYAPDSQEHFFEVVFSAPLAFKPGSRYAYSNAGFSLLAAVVEHAAGRPYEEFLYEQLLAPAGMEATGYVRPDWDGRWMARWYAGAADNGHALEKPYPYWNIIGNGEMLSTVGDMYRWHRALLSDDLLDGASRERMHTVHVREQALGWQVEDTDLGRIAGHNGASDLGASALFRRYLDADLAVVLFCNQAVGDVPMVVPLEDKLDRLIAGEDLALPPEGISLPSAGEPGVYAGAYALPGGGQFTAVPAGRCILVSAEGQPAINRLAFPDLPPDAHAALNRTHAGVFRAYLDGDPEPLRAFMVNADARWDAVSGSLDSGLAEAGADYGELAGLEIAGTVPSNFVPGALDTLVSLSFERGEAGFLSITRDGRNVGVAFLELAQAWTLPCVPHADGLAGYHIPLEMMIDIEVDRDEEGRVVGLAGAARKGD